MTETISWSRLPELGQPFVLLLHRHMIGSRYGICYVAERDGVAVGYAAAATDCKRFYRDFVWRYGLRAALVALPRFIRGRPWEVIARGLTYFPSSAADGLSTEVISFVVDPALGRSGVGRAIFLEGVVPELRRRGFRAVKFGSVEETNVVGNNFYRRLGCELARTVPFYKNSRVNVWVYRIDPTSRDAPGVVASPTPAAAQEAP